MVNKKNINIRIKPYVLESEIQIAFDFLIVMMLLVVLMLAEFYLYLTILIAMCYLVATLFFHYKVVIQAIIDKRKEDYNTEIVTIKKFDNDYSFVGPWGHGYIRFLYPKELQVWKYKVEVVCDKGEVKKLRTVMSTRRMLNFAILDKHQIKYLQVTYLKRSKILLHVDLVDNIEKNTHKSIKRIDKAIHNINMLI